jgi:hypothetical protein
VAGVFVSSLEGSTVWLRRAVRRVSGCGRDSLGARMRREPRIAGARSMEDAAPMRLNRGDLFA